MRRAIIMILTALMLWLAAMPAGATEYAFGRYIPGLFAGPASQIVPPVPGVYWQNSTFYYKASADKEKRFPMGRELKAGLEINYFTTSFTGVWVPEWSPAPDYRVAVGLTIPIQSLRTTASLGRFESVDHCEGLGDIIITPAIGWNRGPHLLSANLSIYLPTGRYNVDDMANIGMNYWTFTPSVAYTYMNPARHMDISFTAGVDINTRNSATDYRSGEMAHMDLTALYTFENGLGLGAFGSVLYQIADDSGALADRLNGFRGRSFAIGPMIKYTGHGPHAATINLNWAPEFGVKNRLEGNAIYLNFTGRF